MVSGSIQWDRNVSELPLSPPREVYSPASVDEVVGIVRSHTVGGPRLRSVSTGRNWGLGSATTDDADTSVIDLSRMDVIRSIDEDLGYAVIEPGVTQHALVEALAGTDWLLNCTASSAFTSVLGNAMDRGIGARRPRTAELLGLEVVLGDGRAGTVGWWPTGRGSAPNRYGLGPSLLHVFTQANFAVVTAAVVQLEPRAESVEVVTATIDESRFGELVTQLRTVVRQQLSSGVVKVYDRVATDLFGGREAVVTTHVCVEGTSAVVAAKRNEITTRLRSIGATIIDPSDPVAGSLSSTVTRLFQGDVSHNEEIVRSAVGVSAPQVDEAGKGFIFCVPFVPFTVRDVTKARGIVSEIAARTGLAIGTTANALSRDVVDLVVAVTFDRDTQKDVARRALDALTDEFVAAGYFPYRLDTTRRRSDIMDAGSTESLLIDQLHDFLDPGGVFSPSRYTR